MLKFWLNRDLRQGLHGYDADRGVEIVEVTREANGERWFEPGPSLADIEAMQRYIQGHFPDGWHIVDGRIRGRDG